MFVVIMDDATSVKWLENDPFPGCLIGNISKIVELSADESELTLIKDIFWSYSRPMADRVSMAQPVCSIPMPYGSTAVWYGDFARTICANLYSLDRPNEEHPGSRANQQDVVFFRTTTNQDVIDVCTTNQCSLMRHHGNSTRIGRIVKALPLREKHTCWLLVPCNGVNYDTLELQQIYKKLDELNSVAWEEKDG